MRVGMWGLEQRVQETTLNLRHWRQEVFTLETAYAATGQQPSNFCKLTLARRKVTTYAQRLPRVEQALARAEQRLQRHLHDLEQCRVGRFITRGEPFAHIGPWEENGNWPPHLHFQIIADIRNFSGDYPGVCKMSEALKYLSNCPDPNLVLNIQPTG